MKDAQNKINSTAYIFYNRRNVEVTREYLNIIKVALNMIGYSCEYVSTLRGITKDSLIVYAVGVDAYRHYFRGYRNIILWQQGATGAESYLKHSSKLRRYILNHMDCFVMKKAKMVFYVSDYMKKYYEGMAKANFDYKAYIMPCFNEVFDERVFEKKDYSKKVFAYVGSLNLWQCFNETAELYAEIEKRIPDTFFKVLAFDTKKAEEIIKKNNIKNYSVSCVPKEQVKNELENSTYGFIIRHDTEVNRVATPTKISSYLSAGVLPIYSTCLRDFHAQAEGKPFAFAFDTEADIEGLIQFINKGVDKDIVCDEIKDLFETYYSTEKHITKIADFMKFCLN